MAFSPLPLQRVVQLTSKSKVNPLILVSSQLTTLDAHLQQYMLIIFTYKTVYLTVKSISGIQYIFYIPAVILAAVLHITIVIFILKTILNQQEQCATWLLMSFICLSSSGRRQMENGDGMSDGNRCRLSLMNTAM